MFEGGKAMHLDRIVTKAGIEGTMRVLHKLKLRDFTKELARDEKPNAPIVVNSSSWVRAKYSGMFRSYKANGSFVSKGERIGTITDPFGDFEKIVKAKWDGYVICVNHNPIVNQGDALMHITQELANG
jgi:predicted deacylase